MPKMKGWEVYSHGFGYSHDPVEYYHSLWDEFHCNTVHSLLVWYVPVCFIRQPELTDMIAERLRLHNCAKIMQRQWLQALYNPERQMCSRLLLKEFAAM